MRLPAAMVLVAWAGVLGAQTRVVITDVGPGASGPILRDALKHPYRLAEPDTARLVIAREVQVRGTLIVLGRSALIEGTVIGDVIVVNGDLFVRPGATIGGRAIVIGGGAYPSALAVVTGGSTNFRDNTYEISHVGNEYRLAYRSTEPPREAPLLFPEVYGFRLPSYDRVDGLSVPFGPAFSLAHTRGRVDVLATWRSNLGAIDPSARASLQLTRRLRATLEAGRGTYSNDDWIRVDWVNSLSALTFGDDTRNHFRADRATATLFQLWEGESVRWEPFVGVSTERDWSVGSSVGAAGGPWSALGRSDTLHMRRSNPAVVAGNLTSALAGTSFHWEAQEVVLDARTRVEASVSGPGHAVAPLVDHFPWKFEQATTEIAVTFPVFGEQEYAADIHWVTTAGHAPPQRFVYLGGSGTLPFLDMLSLAGDQLFLLDQRYSIPVTGIDLGEFGNPALQLRHRIAAAGFSSLPRFETMIGVGVAVVFVRGEVQVNPATGKARLAAGFTFSR